MVKRLRANWLKKLTAFGLDEALNSITMELEYCMSVFLHRTYRQEDDANQSSSQRCRTDDEYAHRADEPCNPAS